MEKQDTTVPASTIVERGRRIKMAADIGLVRSSGGRHWGRALRRKLRHGIDSPNASCSCKIEAKRAPEMKEYNFFCKKKGEEEEDDDDENEEAAVEKRVRALQRLVPGGETLGIEKLFEETADYIEALEEQVMFMRALASFLGGLEREKMIAGG